MSEKIVRIGGASGAWGDSPTAIPQLLTADVDYLMMDYLAEVTMSLLARARMKDPTAGYPPDFVRYLKEPLPEIARRGIKVVSNAGGVNPDGAKAALEAMAAELGLELTIAVVEGDDLLPRIEELRGSVHEAVTGAELPKRLLTANAYLGAIPIARALADGADIVVTGRCADSALALGILMHEFGWAEDDYDRLAGGSLVGHILECGPQSTGGTFTDWADVPGWDNIGYPIAECREDGSFVLTKPAGTGGLIARGPVAEQTLYEVGDPTAYLLPDVSADFSNVSVEPAGNDRVLVSGAKGQAPTDSYKVSATFQDGYRAIASVSIVGPDAVAKAERTAEAMVVRCNRILGERGLSPLSHAHHEALGSEASYGPGARSRATREVLLRLVVEHPNRDALELFAREAGSIGLSFAPGTTGIYSGRPKPTPVVRLYTFYISKTQLTPITVTVGEKPAIPVAIPVGTKPSTTKAVVIPAAEPFVDGDMVEVPLERLAFARSGDKGDSSNIAIIARKPDYVSVIRREVTPERMEIHFAGIVAGPTTRYEAPGLHAFNFLIENALGGGGMASRRIDPQGKAFGQMALEMTVRVPRGLLD